ncbi:RPA-related protein RADX isoform X2 [Scyliorhinus canicula]|uniref:RPA-related protein RADX isoform X2 n=1 Tax=Scyliorhinus canicula TaxID=7830 RepID=UPI0018F67790|nr:RPA-related protein RADX isoform X2 [Scyliorhinus canicula]
MSTAMSDSSAPSVSLDGAAEEGTSSFILSLLHQLISPSILQAVQPDRAEPVVVVAVQRYLGEPGDEKKPRSGSRYFYDVTVSDGVSQVKCYLAPDLNPLVHWNRLKAGNGIHITRCRLVYDEKRQNHCFLQIEALELAAAENAPTLSIPVLSTESLHSLTAFQRGRDLLRTLQVETPLKDGKIHYLPLWNNNDPYGGEWNGPKGPPFPNVSLGGLRLISLQQLEMTWRTKLEFPHLLVRIMHKSRLRYYGKPGTKVDFPYQAYFEVADQSGMMPLVLWNSLCPEWYQSLHVGTALLLHRYSIKRSYQMRTWATPCDPQIKRLRTIEICLNPRDPRAEIQIVPTEQVKAKGKLPDIKYNFITRLELDKLPDGYTCDVIGVVTFVGRCQRIRREDGSGNFYLYRWVHAVDGSTEQPFILEVFATSQPETFQQIDPMTYLVCTQMRVVREFRPGGTTTSVPYLTTSNESQISITGRHKGQPYTRNEKVQGFIRWMKGQQEKDVMKRSVIGGYYSYPPAPNLFQDYCKNLDAEAIFTSASELKKEIETLHYREHRRILLHGTIAAVGYICHRNLAERLGVEPVPKQGAQGRVRPAPEQDNAVSASTSETVRLGEGPEKDTNVNRLHVHPVKDHPKHSLPVLNHYALRSRYPLRDLQKTYCSKWQAHKPLREKLAEPQKGVLEREKQAHKSRARKRAAPVQVCERDADTAASSKGLLQGAEEPVTADEDDHRRCSAGTATDDASGYSWKSPTWPELREGLSEHLHFGQLLPESIPRKYVYEHRDFLMCQCNLQAAEYRPVTATPKMDLQSFASTHNHGYYNVTIVGINHQVAIDVVFLPAGMCHESHRMLGLSVDIHDNTLASIMARGYVCDEQATDNNQQTLPSSSPGQIVKTAADLDCVHVICVLDVCHHGGNTSEVILNKIYKATE